MLMFTFASSHGFRYRSRRVSVVATPQICAAAARTAQPREHAHARSYKISPLKSRAQRMVSRGIRVTS